MIKIKFGKHKGKFLKDIPRDYLNWLYNNKILKNVAYIELCKLLEKPKNKYTIVVEDSVNQDGEYTIEAYTPQHAINICQNKVQCTQSFCGTSFSIKPIINH